MGLCELTRDKAHLAKVAQLPCAVCQRLGLIQTSRTTVHHTICGRYSQRRTPDREAIPLCDCHHQGLWHDRDRTKLAIHAGKESWVASYGEDTDYIEETLIAIDENIYGV